MNSFLGFLLLLVLWMGGVYWLIRNGSKKKRRRRRWKKRYPSPLPQKLPESKPEPEPAETSSDPCVWIDTPDRGYPDMETIDFDCQSFVDHVKSGPFLFKPVVQLGRQDADDGASFDLVWASLAPGDDWHVDIECGDPCRKHRLSDIEVTPVDLKGLTRHFFMRVRVSGVNPGQRLEYKLFRGGEQVFASTTQAPFGPETKAHRFAVVGDMGVGRPGQKKIASRIWNTNPDLMVFVGDITYRYGRAGEYMLRFFPVYNADQADEHGAPLLRSTLSFTSAGNHCMAKAHPDDVPSFDTYADIYAYFLYWSMPLNGPDKVAHDASTADLVGDRGRVNAFLGIAGERFPKMANFSFDYGNVHWLVLDANAYMDWTEEKLRKWIEADLASVDASMWKFVNFHQPPFTSNLKHKREKRMRLLCDLFEMYGVHVVFNGHSHTYERTYPLRFTVKPFENGKLIDEHGQVYGQIDRDLEFDGRDNTTANGVIYVVTGAGGAPHDSGYLNDRPHLWESFTYRLVGDRFSFTVCDIDGDKLTLRQIDEDGSEIDRMILTK